MDERSLEVPEDGRTLAVWVRELCDLSHRLAKRAIESGQVFVGDTPVSDPVYRPRKGDVVRFRASAQATGSRPSLRGPGFRVLHMDRHMLVVDKSPGVVTIPTSRPKPDDLPLVARVGAALQLAGHRAQELWVVHRIDRETSGLVVLARGRRSYSQLKEQFRHRRPKREYLAWVDGRPEPNQGLLCHSLAEEEDSRRMTVVPHGGDPAELSYDVQATSDTSARVLVRLATGRRNQIRVQFSHSGWPLIGDRYYGSTRHDIERTALHAWRLTLRHPSSNDDVTFECPLPRDLLQLDRYLFG